MGALGNKPQGSHLVERTVRNVLCTVCILCTIVRFNSSRALRQLRQGWRYSPIAAIATQAFARALSTKTTIAYRRSASRRLSIQFLEQFEVCVKCNVLRCGLIWPARIILTRSVAQKYVLRRDTKSEWILGAGLNLRFAWK